MSGLVIFDCDGVLVNTEAMISRARLVLLNSLGFPVTEADTDALRRLSSNDAYGRIAKQFNRPMPDDIRERFRAEFSTQLRQGLPPTQGVAELIGRLIVPYCVASNGAHKFMEITLGAAKLADKFSGRIFSADEVAHPKPHPALFEYAARKMGTPPDACIVIEDSVHGVTAGSAAGMSVIGFVSDEPERTDQLLAAGAQAICASMDEVSEHLAAHGYLA